MKAPEVVRRLTTTAIDKGTPGRDPSYGFGVINLVGALTAEIPAATGKPAVSATLVATPPSEPDRFPWWILVLAAVAVAAIAVGAVILARRRGV